MCGIAGVVNFACDNRPLLAQVSRMSRALTHRGPDDAGSWSHQNVAFAHRRLSIIDILRGAQPMSSADGRIWVSYNGEIYNYRELKNALEKKGHLFRTQSDTEVLIASYREYGIDCLNVLEGMFAFALTDLDTQQTFLVRDRLGIKPLYYAVSKEGVAFASELRALAVSGLLETVTPDVDAIADYLSYRQPLDGRSFIQGVASLEPGHFLRVTRDGASLTGYWSVPAAGKERDLGEEAYRTQLIEHLERVLKSHRVSDVPVSAFLSGGLDSSIIVALMAAMTTGRAVHTYCAGFDEEGYSELEDAKDTSRRFGTVHCALRVTEDEYIATWRHLVENHAVPLSVPNEIPIYLMSRTLREYGSVVLSGEGADELFGGYGRIFRSPLELWRAKWLRTDPTLPDGTLKDLTEVQLDGAGVDPETVHFTNRYSLVPAAAKLELFAADLREHVRADPLRRSVFAKYINQTVADLNTYEKYLWLFVRVHLPGLLNRLDRATMAASVEGRVPFADHKLVEFACAVPVKYKLRWRSEEAARRALGLPVAAISEVLDTPKYILRTAASKWIPREII